MARDALAAADERALAAVREELLGEVIGRRDGHRGGRRQLAEQGAYLDELALRLGIHRLVGDELVVVLGEVHGGANETALVGQAAGLVQVDDLVRLERQGERARDGIGVDDEDLALRRLAERRDDGEDAGLRRLGDGRLADRGDLAHQTEIGRLDALHLEDARRERPHARAEALDGLDETQVRLVEDAPRDLEGRGGHLAEAFHARYVDAGLRERAVELDVAAVNDDRHEPHALQEGEGRRERIQVVLDDRPARLHDRELRGRRRSRSCGGTARPLSGCRCWSAVAR